MQEPTSAEDVLEMHKILRAEPQRYLSIVNNWIHENSRNDRAYYDRHLAWMKLGKPRLALDDLDKAIELNPKLADFLARGGVHRHLGEYGRALEDYGHGETMSPVEWNDIAFGLLYQADCHARLGNEPMASSYCARLPDDFWSPGVAGAPAGGKAEIASKLHLIAAEASKK